MELAVVMPAFNAGRFIAEAIGSVLRQTHAAWKLLVIDDGSADDTLAVARSFEARDGRVKVLTQGNAGIANTMNRALEEVDTEWVACMHADDVMLPTRLERQAAFVRENPDVSVVSSLVVLIDAAGREIGRSRSPLKTADAVRRTVAAGGCVAFHHPATMFRKSVVRAVGGYRQEFWPAEDTELFNRIAGAGHGVLVQDEYLLKYRIHGSSASMSKSRLMVQKLAWMERCMACRRRREPEPTWEQFLAARRWNDHRLEWARTLYQSAIGQFSAGRYAWLLPPLAAAALLEPSLVLPRVFPEIGAPRVTLLLNNPSAIHAPASRAAPARMRVLVSAYAVSPDQGSEPGVGWNVCSRLAAHHDLTVLCAPGCPGDDADGFRREIDAHLRKHGPLPGLSFHFVPHTALSRLFQRETGVMRRTVYYTGYAAWQRAAFRAAAALHARRPFDVVHQLNITGYREPGYLWKLGAPFVWGPVGGAADVPAAYLGLMSPADRFYYRARNVGNALQKRFKLRSRRAARAAAHAWAIGEENRRMMRGWGCEAEAVIESGTTEMPHAAPRRYGNGRPLRVVWSGQHIGRKALPILLHAMTRVPADALRCTVLGAGPETARWRALADTLGVADRITWTGEVPRAAALEHVGRADVLAFTSVQEGTPHAVLEALSLGVAVVCHDACGMGVAVTEACGIKIPMQSPGVSIAGFARALRRCREEPGLVEALSDAAIRRSRELSWDHLADRIAAAYRRCGVRSGSAGTTQS